MLERQIMVKQLQELQRKKRLQELNDGKQKIIDQISLARTKSSSEAQPGLYNGITVRDPSQMFKFGDTNLVQDQNQVLRSVGTVRDPSQMFKFGDTNLVQGPNQVLQSVGLASTSLLTKDESQQAGTFSISFKDGQFKASSGEDAVTLDPPKQKFLFSTEGNNGGTISFKKTDKSSDLPSLQSGSLSALTHSTAAKSSSGDSRLPYYGLRFSPSSQRPHVNNFDSASSPYFGSQSPIISVEKLVGQQFSSFEAKPHFMTSGVTQQAASPTQLPNTWADVPAQLNISGMGSCEPSSIKASIKNGSVTYDDKISQGTSLSHLKPARGNYIDFSIPSQPRQDKAPSSLQVGSTGQSRRVGAVTGKVKAVLALSSSKYMQKFRKSKKRKIGIFKSIPWHKEVTQGYSRFHTISGVGQKWARSVGRLPEALKEEAAEEGEEVAGSLWTVRQKRRLSLTTQLMQLLFRPAPAIVLSEDATAHCDTVIFYAAKLSLGDACSLCSASSKNMTSKSSREQDLSRTVRKFYYKKKRLEDELSRLEKGKSLIMELGMDFQGLEKISMVNRFAKRHMRGPMVTDTSSGVATAMPKLRPQKYIKASKMPKTIPDEQNCLSL